MLLQPHTQAALDQALQNKVHGILLSGPQGAGKGHVARYFAIQSLGLKDTDELAKHPYFSIIAPEKNSISIDQIRELQKLLQLKTLGQGNIRRVVIVEDAHHMTNEAQNALLKSLEEPPADTIIILTAPKSLQLKVTIYSRVQQVPILPITQDQAHNYFSETHQPEAIKKAHMMSGGRAGLMHALLTADDHELANAIQQAKRIVGQPKFERLAQVDELAKQKETLPVFLQALKLIFAAALEQSIAKQDRKKADHWHRSLQAVYDAETALPANPNTKLLLTDLLLNL